MMGDFLKAEYQNGFYSKFGLRYFYRSSSVFAIAWITVATMALLAGLEGRGRQEPRFGRRRFLFRHALASGRDRS